MYNCKKCGAPACGMDTSCDCWSPQTGWKVCPTCGSSDKEVYMAPCHDQYWQGSADKFHTYLSKPIKLRKHANTKEKQ